MRYLTKGVYWAKAHDPLKDEKGNHILKMDRQVKMWHDCEKYRGGAGRVRLDVKGQTDDTATFACPHCGFEYALDKHLNLK